MEWKIPLFKIHWDDNDAMAVKEAVEAGMYWAEGPKIRGFEEKIAGFTGSKYSVVFNSGTSALYAALIAHGIKNGSEVIVPSFTFIATANSVLFVRAKPVFADIERGSLGLNPEDVLEKITKKTAAIIPVHYGGGPCRIDELREIADDHGLVLIEDAAEAFGAELDGEKIGTFGDSGMFSFCQNKIISTGEGGAIVTDDPVLYEKLKLIRSHGRSDSQNYFLSSDKMDYIALGYNFRMSNITAALGLSQLSKIEGIIKSRIKVANKYQDILKGTSHIETPTTLQNARHVYQLYSILVKGGRDNLKLYLEELGVMTKIYFDPVHLTRFYKNILKYDVTLEVTEEVSKEVLSLPMHPGLADEEIEYIANKINDYSEGC